MLAARLRTYRQDRDQLGDLMLENRLGLPEDGQNRRRKLEVRRERHRHDCLRTAPGASPRSSPLRIEVRYSSSHRVRRACRRWAFRRRRRGFRSQGVGSGEPRSRSGVGQQRRQRRRGLGPSSVVLKSPSRSKPGPRRCRSRRRSKTERGKTCNQGISREEAGVKTPPT
jgi:hypothetical protein